VQISWINIMKRLKNTYFIQMRKKINFNLKHLKNVVYLNFIQEDNDLEKIFII